MQLRSLVLLAMLVASGQTASAQAPSRSMPDSVVKNEPGAGTAAEPSRAVRQKFSPGKRADYDAMVATHARANDVPEALVHRVIVRESKYQPHLVSKGNIGLMQIKLATARGLGYTGTAEGLRDANTNMTYAVKYLAGAWRLADGSQDRAVSYYARGYYYAAKARGMSMLAAVRGSAAQANGAALQVVSIKDTGRRRGRSYMPASPRLDELTEASAPLGLRE